MVLAFKRDGGTANMSSLSRRDFLTTAGAAGIAAPFATRLITESVLNAKPRPSVPDGPYDVVRTRDVMVRMRDGVLLATDIYLPAKNGKPLSGPFPVLLSRTPYGKAGAGDVATARLMASHGYADVVQDVRGRFASQGTFYLKTSEGKDGYDTVEWIAKQPWCNGKVGSYGASYLAETQTSMSILRPPHLVTMFIEVSSANYYEDGAYAGGAFALLHNLDYAMALASDSPRAHEILVEENPTVLPDYVDWADNFTGEKTAIGQQFKNHLMAWIRAYPFRPNASPLLQFPTYEKWFQDFVNHPYLGPYWEQDGFMMEGHYSQVPDIPVHFVTGWYDLFFRGTLANYVGMAKAHRSLTQLIVGAWPHGVGPDYAGDVNFGHKAAVDLHRLQLDWFDHVLLGKNNGVAQAPAVRMFIMGGGTERKGEGGRLDHGGRWVKTTAWPPPESKATAYYLHGDGTLSESAPGASETEFTEYAYDPANPVPTIGGKIDSGKQLFPWGPWNQSCAGAIAGSSDVMPLSARRDVLVFQTPPLKEPVEIAGPVHAELWISSSAPDTDFTAKLIDVIPPNGDYPDGYAMNLADRITRVRSDGDRRRSRLLTPGEVRKVTIDLIAAGNHFAAGHCIRVDISSSNYPFFDANPNTGERMGHQTHIQVALNRVHHSAQRPSRILLPLRPATA